MSLPPIRRFFALAALLATVAARADIAIEAPGAPAELADLRAHLTIMSEPCDAPPWRIKRRFRRIDEEARPALRAFGYYRAEVTSKLDHDDKCWQVKLVVTPGEPVKVRTLDLHLSGAAADDPEFLGLGENLPLKVGDVLHHGRYEDIKSQLRGLALERGYFDAAFKQQELRVDPDAGRADILLRLDSGRRYRFGELLLSEQPLDDGFVRRLAAYEPGTPYDARRIVSLDRNLSDAGYFRKVEVRPQRNRVDDGAVPVEVTLEPLPRHAWRAGIGFATDTGPRLSFGYASRYVNRRGHRFDSELRLSPVESGPTANYTIPGRDPHKETYGFGAGLLHEDTDTSESDSARLDARQTLKHKHWSETRFIELLHERSTIGGDETRATLLMPGIGFSRTYVDDPMRTRRGYRLGLDLRGAHDALLSTATLLQARANAKGIYRFGDAGRVNARMDLGTTVGGDFPDLPASLRFFAGGDNSVRGYDYESLSPVDDDGEAVGGHHLIAASLEYEHPVHGEDWWAAAFADAGNAFDNHELDIKYGYGAGLRWYTPVGRLRIDLAFPNDTRRDSWRIHFGFGADL